ncbi:MAG: hypothetical protein SX243_16680 [Acidobacteriota bacterium]|nr:hypothetical protein [Acidobacteriota bacterium]
MKKALLYVTAALALAAVLTVPAFAADAPADAVSAVSLELTTPDAPAADAAAAEAVTFPTTSTFDAQPMAFNCQPGYIPPSSCVCGGCCDLCRCWNGGHLAKCIPW